MKIHILSILEKTYYLKQLGNPPWITRGRYSDKIFV